MIQICVTYVDFAVNRNVSEKNLPKRLCIFAWENSDSQIVLCSFLMPPFNPILY